MHTLVLTEMTLQTKFEMSSNPASSIPKKMMGAKFTKASHDHDYAHFSGHQLSQA